MIADAQGEAARFDALYAEYRKAPEVTRQRIYLETMNEVLPQIQKKIVVDEELKGFEAAAIEDGAKELDMVINIPWLKAGDDALDIFLIQQLETVLTTVTERVKALEIGEVTLLDGGQGTALPQHIAARELATLGALLDWRRDWLQPERLAGYELTPLDIEAASAPAQKSPTKIAGRSSCTRRCGSTWSDWSGATSCRMPAKHRSPSTDR